jgi:hypothetical protein
MSLIGGGTAGLMAAIRVPPISGLGLWSRNKGNTPLPRLGRDRHDHFGCHLPEVHGPDRRR